MATIKHKKRPVNEERTLEQWMEELEGDIRAAEEQAGHALDRDINDGDLDDEDLSDA